MAGKKQCEDLKATVAECHIILIQSVTSSLYRVSHHPYTECHIILIQSVTSSLLCVVYWYLFSNHYTAPSYMPVSHLNLNPKT